MLMGNKKVKYEDKTLQSLKEIYEDGDREHGCL